MIQQFALFSFSHQIYWVSSVIQALMSAYPITVQLRFVMAVLWPLYLNYSTATRSQQC